MTTANLAMYGITDSAGKHRGRLMVRVESAADEQ
jgi:hypothetical protein